MRRRRPRSIGALVHHPATGKGEEHILEGWLLQGRVVECDDAV